MSRKKRTVKITQEEKQMLDAIGQVLDNMIKHVEKEGLEPGKALETKIMEIPGKKKVYDVGLTFHVGGELDKKEKERVQLDLVKQTAIDSQLENNNKKEKKDEG